MNRRGSFVCVYVCVAVCIIENEPYVGGYSKDSISTAIRLLIKGH